MNGAAGAGLLLPFPQPQAQPQQWRLRHFPHFSRFSPNLNSFSHLICPTSRHRDSNLLASRNQNFNFTSQDDDDDAGFGDESRRRRRWWSDESSPAVDTGFGAVEEIFDRIWIFKLFGSFGWFFPFIISSMLLATGPKAFVMALAIPLGQSAVSIAFEKLWGMTENKPKYKSSRRPRTKKRARSRTSKKFEAEEPNGNVYGKMNYQSWVAGNDNNLAGNDNNSSFGGWDELDKQREFQRRPAQKAGESRESEAEATEKGKKGGRRVGKGETPLLLRLLIAFFPFLGSWTRML